MKKQENLYQVIPDETGTLTVFGIQALGSPEIYHISSDRFEVENLVQKFNQCRLSPLHLSDAIQDYLRLQTL